MANQERRRDVRRKNERRGDDRRDFNRGTSDRRKLDRRNNTRREEDREKEKSEEEYYLDQVEGRNAIIELLESGKDINKLYITKGEKTGSINKIIAMAKEKKVVIVEKEKSQMEKMAQSNNYQGVIAIVPPFEYCEIEDILDFAKEREEAPFILILDGLQRQQEFME